MSKDAELRITTKDEQFIRSLKRDESAIRSFGDKTIATFGRMGQAVRGFSDKYINSLAAVGIGFGFVEMTKDMIEWEGTLRKIGRTSGASAEDIKGLRDQIRGLIDPNAKMKIPLTKGQWADIAAELNNTGIELKTIRDIMPQVGIGAVAAHADTKIYSGTIGDFLDKYKVALKDLPALQEQLNKAMKFGDVRKNPDTFLQQFSLLAKDMQLMKTAGMESVTPIIALESEFTQITGSASTASDMISNLVNGMVNFKDKTKYVNFFKGQGINLVNEKGLRPIQELLPELAKLGGWFEKHKMRDEDITALFGRPGVKKAMIFILQHYDEIMAKQRELKASSGDMAKDFITEQAAMENKLRNFQNQIDSFKVDHMANALKYLTGVIDTLNKHPLIANGLLSGLLIAGGIVVADKAKGIYNKGRGLFGSGKQLGGIGAGIPGDGGVPVHVTNWPGSMIPGGGTTLYDKNGRPIRSKTPGGSANAYIPPVVGVGVAAAATMGAMATLSFLETLADFRTPTRHLGAVDPYQDPTAWHARPPWLLDAITNTNTINIDMKIDENNRVWANVDSLNTDVKINNFNRGGF